MSQVSPRIIKLDINFKKRSYSLIILINKNYQYNIKCRQVINHFFHKDYVFDKVIIVNQINLK